MARAVPSAANQAIEPVRRKGKVGPQRALLAVLVTASLVVTGMLAVGQSLAEAAALAPQPIKGLVRIVATSALDSVPVKHATARCPADKVLLGGGGRLIESGVVTHRLTLQNLEVYGDEKYSVTGAEVPPGVSGAWRVEAYAICAVEPPGYEVRAQWSPPDTESQPVQYAVVNCPAGKVPLGASASIWDIEFLDPEPVGLQIMQVAGTSGGSVVASARELAGGVNHDWRVMAEVICAYPPKGYELNRAESTQAASETDKEATASCTSGRKLLGTGARATALETPNVSLMDVFVPGLGAVRVYGVENLPVTQNWGRVVSQAICAIPLDVD
jgi:hypothetical protein